MALLKVYDGTAWVEFSTAAPDVFKTINCPSGTDPVADDLEDTLNLTTANAHLTITGTSGTDTVDFAVVTGTFGAKIPILSAANTWSGDQLFGTATEIQFRDTNQYVRSASAGTLQIGADTGLAFQIGGGTEAQINANILTFSDGGVTTSLDWSTPGKLAFRVSSTEQMSLTAAGLDVALLSKARTFESDIVTGLAPIVVASTTVCANLNVDQVDGADVGTSGAAIPLMNGVNTWSANQLLSGTTEMQFNQTSESISSPFANALTVDAATAVFLAIGGTTEATLTAAGLDVINLMSCESVRVDGDVGGAGGTVTFTDITSAESGLTGGTATLGDFAGAKETGPATGLQTGWLKIYDGTTEHWVATWV